ncbi:MAG: transposase zinc-binding domain-containing protein [Verrucomicrobiales bacterium]|nr:transposase zinc-binding domain-containing protein [Verrucomicrobiales bacterium]
MHHGWDDFQTQYEASYRKAHGPLRSDAIEVVEKFYRCGDLAQGFTRLHCKDCGHEKLLAFTCKTRGYCPSCHQRRSLETADWIAKDITFNVPHRMYVFTIPRVLRAIFRKRRKLLTHLFLQSIEALKLWMQSSLGLPHGQIAAIAVVHTFGDYLGFHPHMHILAVNGLIDTQNRFHPLDENESLTPLKEIFRNLFIKTLVDEKLLSQKKADQLLSWKTSGFTLDAGDAATLPFDRKARRQFAEYMLRAPFSIEKIHWNEKTNRVIYRSKRS